MPLYLACGNLPHAGNLPSRSGYFARPVYMGGMMLRIFIMSIILMGFAPCAFAGNQDTGAYLADEVQAVPEETLDETVRVLQEKSRHLYDVLKSAYQDNPTLNAARSKLRAVEEKLPQALSNYRPRVTADGSVVYSNTDTDGGTGFSPDGSVTTKTAAVNLTQPLYRGGRTIAETQGAKDLILSEQAVVRQAEQTIMLSAITAYMDVLRDKALLNVAEQNSDVLLRQVEMSQDRFDVGEITKTDVAQAESRLAQSESDIASARANLRASIASYEQVTGAPPEENLLYPEILYAPPATLDEAISYADENNPRIVSSIALNRAAESDIDEVFGELLPSLTLGGNISRSYDPSTSIDRQDNQSAGLTLSIPLYESGSVRSRVREARHTANQRMLEILETRRTVRQQVIASWERWMAARAQITARQKEVEAADYVRLSLQDQADVGERTVTDSLDAIQDYETALAALISARRDEVVSLFTLAQALGDLSPEALGFTENIKTP
ncbi:MAG: TolC family outer membrane protein [Alphaproteobacteria bacterium]|nr:TolC family outer membrane protein [Alphaproteobacteria bacterium]